jgi:nucleoside-diphosphate-sugar epimerase
MKLLLTGPRGNLGSAICKFSTHEIVRLDRDNWSDIDAIMSTGIDIVIHSAYDLKHGICDYPAHVLDSNIMTTGRLVEAMQRNGVGHIIFISSCAVYGESMNTKEDTRCSPISLNGITKLLNEKVVADYCSKKSIVFQIYRVFNTYGGNDHFSILHHLRQSLESQQPFKLNNNGVSQRDFIHVSDVAKIILQLLEKRHDYQYLNIGTGYTTRIKDIVDIVKDKYPDLMIKNCMTTETEYSRADISKLQSIIDYKFIDVRDYVKSEFNV